MCTRNRLWSSHYIFVVFSAVNKAEEIPGNGVSLPSSLPKNGSQTKPEAPLLRFLEAVRWPKWTLKQPCYRQKAAQWVGVAVNIVAQHIYGLCARSFVPCQLNAASPQLVKYCQIWGLSHQPLCSLANSFLQIMRWLPSSQLYLPWFKQSNAHQNNSPYHSARGELFLNFPRARRFRSLDSKLFSSQREHTLDQHRDPSTPVHHVVENRELWIPWRSFWQCFLFLFDIERGN